MAVIRCQPIVQPLIIHDLFYLPQQMLFRHQSLQVYHYNFFPSVSSPFFHTEHLRFFYYTRNGGILVVL